MKKIILLFLFTLSSVSWAGTYYVPAGYSLKELGGGAKIYKNGVMNVVVVDLESADVDFGGADIYYGNNYIRKSLNGHWNDEYSSSLFAVINGQFYDHATSSTYSPLSFPVRADYVTLTSANNETEKPKRTIVRAYNGTTYIVNGYSSSYLRNKDVFVGLNPSVNKSDRWSIGRNFIGGIADGNCNPDYATCQYRYLLFFVSEDDTKKSMLSEIAKWGVKSNSIVMLDGSGSAQLKSRKITSYGVNNPFTNGRDRRTFPHSILIKKYGLVLSILKESSNLDSFKFALIYYC